MRLPDELLDRPLDGVRLDAPTLREVLDRPRATLLVFLRHLGCIFCRELVADVRRLAAARADFPPVVLVTMGTRAETEAFLDARWPGAAAVCDPDKTLYEALGLGQGTLWQMFGPRVWACGVRATVKGHAQSLRFVGDPWTMPGMFLACPDGEVVWQHRFEHVGDAPDWDALPRLADARAAECPGVADRSEVGAVLVDAVPLAR